MQLRPLLTATLLAASAASAQTVPERLAARLLGDSPIAADLAELCDRIGGRPTGSPACQRAVDWAAARFRAAGLEVKLEPFMVPALWLPEDAQADVIAPVPFPIRLAAAPYTPSVRIEAAVLDAGDGGAADFERLGHKAKGAIVLIRSKEMKTFDDLFAEYLRNDGLLQAAKKHGVAALLLQSTRPRGLLYRHPMTGNGAMAGTPTAIISREHADRLARLIAAGGVRMKLNLRNRTGPAYQAMNVVAEIRGREKPDEVVLLGAHLDSWDLGTGAEDNGVNCAMVIDVARAFQQLGIRPRRTMRFVLFTGEEQGMWGSAGYVQRHRDELDRHVVTLIFDTGSGRTTGFFLSGREELRDFVNTSLNSVPNLSATRHLIDALDGTDNFDFMLAGVPNLVAIQDPSTYLPDYHAESDVFDRSNIREQKTTAAIASTLMYSFAESSERPARRQTRTEVERLLIETKIDRQMKAFGQWPDWISGKRGGYSASQ